MYKYYRLLVELIKETFMKKVITILLLVLTICSVSYAEEQRTTIDKYKNGPGADAIVLVEGLRVRIYPSSDSLIICELPKDTRLGFIEQYYNKKTGECWDYVILPNGYVGWVCEKYIRIRC